MSKDTDTTIIRRRYSDSNIPVPTWKLIIFRIAGRALRAFITVVFVGQNASHWGSLSWMERGVILAGGVVAAWDVLDAFLDSSIARMREGGRGSFVDTDTEITQTSDRQEN